MGLLYLTYLYVHASYIYRHTLYIYIYVYMILYEKKISVLIVIADPGIRPYLCTINSIAGRPT